MNFVRQVRTTRLVSPGEDGRSITQSIEYRRDPLTGAIARINVARAERVRQAQTVAAGTPTSSAQALDEVIARTRANCVFCPENVERNTPTFPADVWSAGRISRGETLIFPNLYPFAEHHAVGILSQEHFLDLDQFTVDMVADSLLAAQQYFGAVHRRHPAVRYPMWIWNYLPPSAASVIHPHVQLLMDRTPATLLGQVLTASKRYYRCTGSNFWSDLVTRENELGERLIHEDGTLAVLASFAPRGMRDVQIVLKYVSGLAELSQPQIEALAWAVTVTLRAYKAAGVNSFNVVTYSAAVGQPVDYFWLSARIISRPRFQPYYTNDTGFMERLFDEWVVETLPEDVARSLSAAYRAETGR